MKIIIFKCGLFSSSTEKARTKYVNVYFFEIIFRGLNFCISPDRYAGILGKKELVLLLSIIIASVLYTGTYIVYIVHKELSCKMKQIQDRVKPDPQ